MWSLCSQHFSQDYRHAIDLRGWQKRWNGPFIFMKLSRTKLLIIVTLSSDMESGEENSNEDRMEYCELLDRDLGNESDYFKFQNHVRLAFASLGLAVSTGVRLNATRELLDMVDQLYQNISDPDIALTDESRKKLNHADAVWLDLKQKMAAGDIRAAHLLDASSNLSLAHSYLCSLKKNEEFSGHISDYSLKYFKKLSVFIYREAIGHVML